MITLSEYFSSLDFDYKVNKNNTISLIDLQDANLAGIEDEEYEINDNLAIVLSDRLTTYEEDYFFNYIAESLQEYFNYNGEIYPYDTFLLPEIKKHPDFFSKDYISFVEDIINCNIDISEIYIIRSN